MLAWGGRPYLYGLSVGGYNGAKYALQLLKDEVEQSMILTGVKNVNELNRSFEEARRMRIKLLIILALLNLNVFAVEGMWEPSQMGTLKGVKKHRIFCGRR